MMKTLVIAYHFPLVGGAGVQRSLKFVQYLPSEGYLPIVVTGPAFSEDRWTPHDHSLLASVPAGVAIHRAEGPLPAASGRLRGRLERCLSLPGPFSRWWIRAATEAALRAADGVRLIFATMSPFESAEVARGLSQRLGIPWVADLRDPWALDEMQVHMTRLHRRREMSRMERLLSTAAVIVMNTPEATSTFKDAFPSLRNKEVVTITNGFDAEDFASQVTRREDHQFRIVHSGYLHTDNGLQLRRRRFYRFLGGAESGVDIMTRSHTVLLEAVERWFERHPEVRHDLEIVLAGKTSAEDRAVVAGSGAASAVRFTGYVSHAESLNLVRTADLLFLPMHNLPAGRRSRIVPGKTYEYMAAGRPILAAVPDGDARDYLRQAGSALVCRPDDVEGMARILERVYTAWKSGAPVISMNDRFVAEFERRRLTKALAKALTQAVGGRRPVQAAVLV